MKLLAIATVNFRSIVNSENNLANFVQSKNGVEFIDRMYFSGKSPRVENGFQDALQEFHNALLRPEQARPAVVSWAYLVIKGCKFFVYQ